MPRQLLLFAFCFFSLFNSAQDSLFTRKVIKYLTSQKCYGRGYIKNGLHQAEKFLVKEIRSCAARPLFDESYTQAFYHNVNTFPGKCEVKINGKKLRPGVDFIPSASAPSLKGSYTLNAVDSVTSCSDKRQVCALRKQKLTYTVGNKQEPLFIIEIDSNRFREIPKNITVNVESKLVQDFESRNIGCYIKGQKDDSMIVFTAHYDHLGGLGNAAFFPGANDNASGVSLLLNLLKHYKEHPPEYRTVFIFFAGEEAGLLGSKHFVESNSLDLKKIRFLVNLDLLGTGDEGIMVVNGAVYPNEFAKLEKLNSEKNFVPQVKKRGKAANSDHYWFTEKGVPAFFIYTMGGIKAYHDVYDIEKTLPLTKYRQVYALLISFIENL